MTADEIRELNARMFHACKPPGVVMRVSDGRFRYDNDPDFGLEWTPATCLDQAVEYRPRGTSLQIFIDDNGAGCDLWVCGHSRTINSGDDSPKEPAAAVCLATLAYLEAKRE